MTNVFLGGTCNGSDWRKRLKPMLDARQVSYFDPVVPDWNEAAYARELHERANSDICLYVITPKMTGVYSIAEVVDDSNKRPEKTVFCFLEEDGEHRFSASQIKSLRAVSKMVSANGAQVAETLDEVANLCARQQLTT